MNRLGEIMAVLREWLERAIGTVRRRRSDGDLARELAFHIEQAELELRRQGLSAKEAYRLARVRSGNAGRAVEQLKAQSSIPWFGAFTLDVRLAGRMLRKFWGLSLIGGLALAAAIAICTSVFLYFDVVWKAELPLDEADRVVAIQIWDPSAVRRRETTLADFERWRDGLESLEDIGAFRSVQRNLVIDGGEGTRVELAEMSAAGFRVARIAPLAGRTLVDGDELPGAAPVAVISYPEWQQRFDGDPGVIGRTIRLDGALHTIVGVMPERFGFPVNHRLWIPLRRDALGELFAPPAGSVFGRLASGFTIDDANAELGAMGLLSRDEPVSDADPPRLLVLPYIANFLDDIDPDESGRRSSNSRLVILLMSLLLVPPGVNIAILVYARTVTRQEEIAIRTALGASRRRIVAQLFLEMLVHSAIAAAVALIGVRLLAGYIEGLMLRQLVTLPFWMDVRLSAGAIVFVAVLAVAAALLTGFLPALRATKQFARPGLAALRSRNRTGLGAFWTALIVAQVAVSFAALPIATELAWGLLRANLLGPGFPAEQYLTAEISLDPNSPLTDAADPARQFARAQEDLFQRLGADPAVIAGPTLVSAIPGAAGSALFEIDGWMAPAGSSSGSESTPRNPWGSRMLVDAAYFESFGARTLTGRTFTRDEFIAPSRTAVVSARFVERTLEGVNPLGLRIRYRVPGDAALEASSDQPWYEIVGVVSDVPAHAYRGTIYHTLTADSVRTAIVAVRLAPGTRDRRSRLLAVAAATNPPLRLSDIRALDQTYEGQALGNYIGGFALITGVMSVILLAAAGTYALMSFTVNERRREIGIRVALGAPAGRLLRAVLGHALRRVLIGAVVGVAIAAFIEQKIPVDSFGGWEVPGVLPAGIAFVILVGILATLGPARRALRLDPNVALRDGG